MFEQTFVNAPARARRPWTIAASLTLQASAITALLLLPLLHPEVLTPHPEQPLYFRIATEKSPIVKRQPVTTQASANESPFRQIFVLADITPPTDASREIIQMGIESLPTTGVLTGGSFGTSLGDGAIGIPGIVLVPKPPEPKHVDPPKPTTGPQRIGGTVQASKIIFGPKPIYPPIARTTRIQGTVRLQAFIAVDGTIRNLQILSGHPLLNAAALDAVRQWRYSATLLNGQPVEVITEIEVHFTLSGN